ncbi:M48 family metallopeptidase [Sedimentitalea nanhaiensis]|uniref:Peptidase family M48 n=1 Tax=Sedimentitalea nanhaiensis TaxID=999627 RepID=A0A1I7E7G2_9RHOB|nr:M48 family metallopeptidase [Sedimentitalea nanhaiensis]SFU19839.1 Peptidase family M48 [Sedimentitalea nanhaiensis]
MRWTVLLPLLGWGLAACDAPGLGVPAPVVAAPSPIEWQMSPELAARTFTQVVQRVEPVAERECQRQARGVNCDFLIAVDPNPRAQPNAFQSEDEQGRPVLTFTASLIGSVRNADELAFVMGHEAAHHIANHLERQSLNAAAAAEIFAGLASMTGGGASDVASAQELGAAVGARAYSKEFELEADRLGTVITWRAGYDPLVGAEYFARIPDPGDRFLGSHPPNAARVETVNRTLQGLRG